MAKLEVQKDWADYKKGSEIDIEDESVVKAGLEIGLFKEVKPKSKKE